MKMTQKDYDERAARIAAGQGDDEDRRLVEHYEREGFGPERTDSDSEEQAHESATPTAVEAGTPTEGATKPTKTTRGRVRGDQDE